MPPSRTRDLIIAMDVAGCPNRCRHCYLGREANPRLTPDDLRWAAAQFRSVNGDPTRSLAFDRLTVMSWAREPDFSPNYRALYALEHELSDGDPLRFELLSVWRLARDPDYARWARSVGTAICQLSLFGVGATQDWFCRRPGAYADTLRATEVLLEAGIVPRWQLFLTRRILPELDDLLRTIDRLHLRERAAELGGAFTLFIHPPGPDGEARHLEPLRPTMDETLAVPNEILAESRAHLGRQVLWRTEADLYAEIVAREPWYPHTYDMPERLCFYIKGNGDVCTNVGTWEPWWVLGNLRRDGAGAIVDRFSQHDCLGLRAIHAVPPANLARRYGDPVGQRVYGGVDDVLAGYLGEYCREASQEPGAPRGTGQEPGALRRERA